MRRKKRNPMHSQISVYDLATRKILARQIDTQPRPRPKKGPKINILANSYRRWAPSVVLTPYNDLKVKINLRKCIFGEKILTMCENYL